MIEDTSRKGQPSKPCTAISAFKTGVFFDLPERVAWGFWACLNGMAVSWVCSMFYDPGVTDTSTTVSAGIKKVRHMIRMSFHPDKSPNSLAVVPTGTPSMEDYAMVFRELTDAVWLIEKFMSRHPTGSVTLLPRDGNMLNTFSLDSFLVGLLKWTDPPVLDEHSKLHNWWSQYCRPRFTEKRNQSKRDAASAREAKVAEARRAEIAASVAATPAPVVQVHLESGGDTAGLPSGGNTADSVEMEVETDVAEGPLAEASVPAASDASCTAAGSADMDVDGPEPMVSAPESEPEQVPEATASAPVPVPLPVDPVPDPVPEVVPVTPVPVPVEVEIDSSKVVSEADVVSNLGPLPDPTVVVSAGVGSSAASAVEGTPRVPKQKIREEPVFDIQEIRNKQKLLDESRDGFQPEKVGGWCRASNGVAWTRESLPISEDLWGNRNMLRLALCSALVVIDYSNLASGNFASCSDELLAQWYHAIMDRQGIGRSGVFLSGRALFNISAIQSESDPKFKCVSGGNFANRYLEDPGNVNVVAEVRKSTRLSVLGDSGLLTFPSSGKGRPININADIKFDGDKKWERLNMLAEGGAVTSGFVHELAKQRALYAGEMVSNSQTQFTSEMVIPEKWRSDGINLADPYYIHVFDENHVALVFMNINDYYGDNKKFIGGDPNVQAEFKIDVYNMIRELRFYRCTAVICGPNAAFWGCVGREAVIMDEAMDFVHEACREHHVPCFRGGPFWEDLVPFRRVVNKKNGNIDQWHHADQGTGQMAYIYDRYFSHLIILLQLTRFRTENGATLKALLNDEFQEPTDFLELAEPTPIVKVAVDSAHSREWEHKFLELLKAAVRNGKSDEEIHECLVGNGLAPIQLKQYHDWIDTCRDCLGIPQFANIVEGVSTGASSSAAHVVEGTPLVAHPGVWSEGDPLLSAAAAVEGTPRAAAGPPVEPDVDDMVDFNYACCAFDSANLRGEVVTPLSARSLVSINKLRIECDVADLDDVPTCFACSCDLLPAEVIKGAGSMFCTECLQQAVQEHAWANGDEKPRLSEVVIEPPEEPIVPKEEPLDDEADVSGGVENLSGGEPCSRHRV